MTTVDRPGEVTRLLGALRSGSAAALDELFPHVYEELRSVARAQARGATPLQGAAGSPTLQPTALVHEAYLKLARSGNLVAGDRGHFMAIAARAMRQIVTDRARAALSVKRGGGWQPVTLTAGSATLALDPADAISLARALDRLDERQRTIVECRFFAGLEESEIAAALGVSERTVRREWVKARAWLYAELHPEPEDAQ
jgi:RNA polymerase sigma factor (TIGR02999 family)